MLRYVRMLLSIALIMLFSSTILSAQSKLHGSVAKAKDQPLAEATVLLLNSTDSSLVKGSLTSTTGNYAFEKIPPGNYIVAASYSGYKKVFSPVVHVDENEQKAIEALMLS
ncbi:MAG: carboxypeptidase-like regulatory domain-containing protein, partial [Flavisolibacter sp.]